MGCDNFSDLKPARYTQQTFQFLMAESQKLPNVPNSLLVPSEPTYCYTFSVPLKAWDRERVASLYPLCYISHSEAKNGGEVDYDHN